MINTLYDNSPYKNIIHDIDGVAIPFDPKWKKISIAVSGGADSALLSFLLCQLITDLNLKVEVHVINNVRLWKTKPWQKYNAIDVLSYLKSKFDNINFYRHENFVPPELEWADKGPTIVDEYGKLVSGDNVELRAFAEYVCFSNNINAYFNAVTKNPGDIDGGMKTRDIEPNAENFHLSIMNHLGIIACHPFRFVTKDWIIRQYRRLGIEDLLSITRSCEGTFKDLNYQNYVPGQIVPECGECFWCKERTWGIENSK
jgi:hypothetical protein